MQIQENIALAPHTTFKIGGPARYFSLVRNVEELKESLDFAESKNLTTFVLGGGSNVLISDKGFDGLVIQLQLQGGFKNTERDDGVEVIADAGESWDALIRFCVEHGLWGLENLSGIPGSVGGAVVQGIGAYGAAIGETLQSVEVYDTHTGDVRTMSKAKCQFDYRDSFFKHDDGRHIVLCATFVLSKEPHPNLSYKDLAGRFGDQAPTLEEIRDAILEIRREKFPDLSVEGTAGSFFKNPIMSREEVQLLKAVYPDIPLFTMPETDGVKVPLAWLLDNALRLKGYSMHGVRLFEKQPLVVVASRDASAKDVQSLASFVQKKVFDELKIKIEPEVKII